MAIPSALSAQFGYKSETTFGTAVVVDKFPPFVSEGLKQDIQRLVSKGIRSGRRTQGTWKAGGKRCGGPFNFELINKPIATWFNHMFGAVVTTGSGPYVHTFTPGDLTGDSFTCQPGRTDIAGTVNPFTYAGCKIADWEIACTQGEIATLSGNISAQSEVTSGGGAAALASVSYLSGITPFVFTEGVLSIAAATVATVRSVSIKGDNGLNVDRGALGSAVVNQQLEANERLYNGTLTTDFESLTAYNRYVNGTEAALVLTFTSGTDILAITTNVRFDGETPVVSGMEMLTQTLPFVCTSVTSDAAAITAVLTNGETTAV